MNCIIIDDEPLARDEMHALVEEVSDIKVLEKFSNAIAALDFFKKNKVDLIFLDIEMPIVNGLEFAAQMPDESLIVFTTAHAQYALQSYEFDAIDYLLKPIEPERLRKAINKAIVYRDLLSAKTAKNILNDNTDEFLFIKSDRRNYKINISEIKFIEGLKDYVVIYSQNQKLITAMNLKSMHQKLPLDQFFRVSKSYLVNKDYIDSFDNQNIYIGETEIPLGTVYRKDFIEKYSGRALL